jgi:Zn-dependent protease with chaperone function
VGCARLGLDVFFLGSAAADGRRPRADRDLSGSCLRLVSRCRAGSGASQVLAASQRARGDPANPRETVPERRRRDGDRRRRAAPKAYVVPDHDPNAFAVGRDPEHASIAVTEGLLAALDREELQGVVGHEMSHVRNLDIRAMTLVTALFGAAMLLSDVARRGLYWGGAAARAGATRATRAAAAVSCSSCSSCGSCSRSWRRSSGSCSCFAVSRSREYLADAERPS